MKRNFVKTVRKHYINSLLNFISVALVPATGSAQTTTDTIAKTLNADKAAFVDKILFNGSNPYRNTDYIQIKIHRLS
jgi:hypothetical protein